MVTIVNNPPPVVHDKDNGRGFLVGVVIVALLILLFFMYGLPALSNTLRGPSVTIPDKVNVNIQTPGNK